MAAATTDRFIAPSLSLPEGHCQPVETGSQWYWVKGRAEWHQVNSETGECTCSHYVFRCAFRFGDLCRHGKRLAIYLAELTACPACNGKAWLVPSGAIRYVDHAGKVNLSPLACILCSGTGRRDD